MSFNLPVFRVSEILSVKGRGTVLLGRELGSMRVAPGDELVLDALLPEATTFIVTRVERGTAREDIGLVVRLDYEVARRLPQGSVAWRRQP